MQYTIQYEGLSTILLVDAGYVRDVVRGSEIIDQDGVSGPRAWIYPMYVCRRFSPAVKARPLRNSRWHSRKSESL